LSEEEKVRIGPFDAAARILRELIRTADFKKALEIIIRDLDPENAASIVRTFMREDTGFAISVLGSAPDILNALIFALREFLLELMRFPEELLFSFLGRIVSGIETHALGEVLGLVTSIFLKMARMPEEGLTDLEKVLNEVKNGFKSVCDEEELEGILTSGLIFLGFKIAEFLFLRLASACDEDIDRLKDASEHLGESIKRLFEEKPEILREIALPIVSSLNDVSRALKEGEN